MIFEHLGNGKYRVRFLMRPPRTEDFLIGHKVGHIRKIRIRQKYQPKLLQLKKNFIELFSQIGCHFAAL